MCGCAPQTLCCLLDCLLTDENTPADSPRELYEIYFVFACVWAFGGALFQDHVSIKSQSVRASINAHNVSRAHNVNSYNVL